MNFDDCLRLGDGVLDLGANDGAYAQKYAKKVGPSGFVLAVEPDPDVAWQAKQRLCRLSHVHVLTAAVGEKPRTSLLHRDREPKRSSLWRDNVLEDTGVTVPVDLWTLDTLAAYVEARVPLKAIKVDVQGAEMRMLQGGSATLQNRDLTWAVEIWPTGLANAGSSAEELMHTFEAAGWFPVEGSWQPYREAAPQQIGHSAMDVVLRHVEAR